MAARRRLRAWHGRLIANLAGHLVDGLANRMLPSRWPLWRNASRARAARSARGSAALCAGSPRPRPRPPHDWLTCPFLLQRPTRRFLPTPGSAMRSHLVIRFRYRDQ